MGGRFILGCITAAALALVAEWGSSRDSLESKAKTSFSDSLGTSARRFEMQLPNGTYDTIDLSRRTALILVFSHDCRGCDLNMPRWLDLIVAARSAMVPVYALGVGEIASEAEYWTGLHAQARVGTVDTEVLTSGMRVNSTPTTLVLRNGAVVARRIGVLGEHDRAELGGILASRSSESR